MYIMIWTEKLFSILHLCFITEPRNTNSKKTLKTPAPPAPHATRPLRALTNLFSFTTWFSKKKNVEFLQSTFDKPTKNL